MEKIIVQEIQAWSKNKEGIMYFPCLISTLYKRHGVPQKSTNEICDPQATFDKVAIHTLMKPKRRRGNLR